MKFLKRRMAYLTPETLEADLAEVRRQVEAASESIDTLLKLSTATAQLQQKQAELQMEVSRYFRPPASFLLFSTVWSLATFVGIVVFASDLDPASQAGVYLSLFAAMFGALFGWRLNVYAQELPRLWSKRKSPS